MAWTSPRTWIAGETLTAALLNTHVRDNLLELNSTASAWSTYTPTLTNFTATITEARYKQIGKTVTGHVNLTLTAGASGTVGVSLPVTPVAFAGTFCPVGTAFATDTGSGYHIGAAFLTTTGTNRAEFTSGASSAAVWNATAPFTWASTDILRMHFTYEAA
jgi:hypothetical protein